MNFQQVFAEEIVIELVLNITEESNNCNYSISINSKKLMYENNEKISFQNVLDKDLSVFKIEYWIEDLFGHIIKKTRNTTNLNTKYYTPKIDEKSKVLIIKNILRVNCQNIGRNSSEKIMIVKNDYFNSSEIKSINEEIFKPKILSFYTRAKKFSPQIKLFASINGGEELLLFSDLKKNRFKIDIPETIEFVVDTKKGKNEYLLFLISDSKIVDFKELKVDFNISEEEKPFKLETKKDIKIEKEELSITGKTIYETNAEIKSALKYSVLAIIIIIISAIIVKIRFDKFI
jgi:hypothetical protein|tara:strand:+ start:1655 stop:2521 length:867 start_codon:yes stop_codon:yes gene_type:complete